MRKLNARQLAREKSLFRYSSALERADFSTVATVLQEAEHDLMLAQMIAEINIVYESETLRLSPSLNHSTNHQQKDHLMTTLVLPNRQRNMQRWLPVTLAAACVSVLFIGALMLRPIRPNNLQAGIQGQSSATPSPTASATLIPSATFTHTPMPAAGVVEASALPSTVTVSAVQFSTGAVGTPVCDGTKVITEDTLVHARPSNNSTAIGKINAGTQAETLATGFAAEDDTSTPKTNWFFIKADVNGNSVQGWVSANIAQPLDPANSCPANEVTVASGVVPATVVAVAVQPVVSSSGVTCGSKDAVIVSPSSNSVVAGTVDISGIATATNFGSYRLEIIGLGTGGKYVSMVDSIQDVPFAGTLGQINLSSFPPDNYGLRLSVFDGAQQLQGRCLVNFTLAREASVPNGVISANTEATVIPITVLPISAVVATETLARTSPATNGALSMTLTAGVVVKVDSQSADGQWSHVMLDGGKNGWVLSSVLQFETTNIEAAANTVPSNVGGTKGIVSVEQTVLRDQPDANARMIRILGHNTTLMVTETSSDGQWVFITLPNGTQGWLLTKEVQTEGVPQVAQPALLCWGTIGEQPAQVYSRPAVSGSGVAINALNPQTNVVILDVDNQSGNATAWYFVQGNSEGKDVQGWVQSEALAQHNYCSLPSSPPDQFTVVMPTPVPANVSPLATVVPPDTMAAAVPAIPATPTAYFDSALRSNPPVIIIVRPIGSIPANAEVQIESAGFDGSNWTYQLRSADGQTAIVSQADLIGVTTSSAESTTAATGICHVNVQQNESVQVFSGPSRKGDESVLVNNLPPNVPAVVLYQQRNKETGAVWYLVLAVMEQGKQISGWVSADSVNVVDRCPSLP